MKPKYCTSCGQDKSLSEFYTTLNGKPRSQCKTCTNVKARAAYPLFKESHNLRMRDHYLNNKEYYKERSRKYILTERGKEVNNACQRKFRNSEHGKLSSKRSYDSWYKNNRLKRLAHWLVKSAIKSGKICKLPCSICGDKKSHAHHDDYSKPLEIVWLCRKHHCELHRILRGNVKI